MTVHRLIRIACVVTCVAAAGTGMACSKPPAPPLTPTPSPTPATIPPGTLRSFELTGAAVGDDGRPVPNAAASVYFGRDPRPKAVTDEMGRYHVNFDAAQDGYVRRLQITAAVYLDVDGYERYFRWFRPTGADPHQTLDLHPRLIRQIAVGESVSVTVAPDDTPCLNNVQDTPGLGPSYVCRPVRVTVPAAGVLTVEAVPADPRASRPLLEMEGPGELDCCYLGNPLTMPVTAGMVVKINVELLEGLPGQTFILTTTIR